MKLTHCTALSPSPVSGRGGIRNVAMMEHLK